MRENRRTIHDREDLQYPIPSHEMLKTDHCKILSNLRGENFKAVANISLTFSQITLIIVASYCQQIKYKKIY